LELAFKSGPRGGQRTQLYLTYLAHRLSARPDPARRAGATTRLGTGALSPQSRPPPLGQRSLHGTPGAGCASLRVHELTRGQSYPTTRTGHLPADLAFSLMPQLHDAMEAGTGRPMFRNAWIPSGPAPPHGRPGAETTTPRTARSTPKAYRYGPETTTLRRLLPVDASGLKPMHGTTTRKGAGPRRCVPSPRRCSPGTARRGRHPPGSDTDPMAIAQWVSLRRPTQVSKTDRPASAFRPTAGTGPNT